MPIYTPFGGVLGVKIGETETFCCFIHLEIQQPGFEFETL